MVHVAVVVVNRCFTYSKQRPGPHRGPKAVFIKSPFHQKRNNGTGKPCSCPEYAVRKPFLFLEPLLNLDQEWVIEESTANAVEQSLGENEMSDMRGE